jgi:hypothetical protein
MSHFFSSSWLCAHPQHRLKYHLFGLRRSLVSPTPLLSGIVNSIAATDVISNVIRTIPEELVVSLPTSVTSNQASTTSVRYFTETCPTYSGERYRGSWSCNSRSSIFSQDCILPSDPPFQYQMEEKIYLRHALK